MADPKAFISYDVEHDEASKNLFKGQANCPTPFLIEEWSSPLAASDPALGEKIEKCDFMIVLVGNAMRSAKGVAAEIAMAKEKDVPLFGIYVDGAATSSELPQGIARGRVIGWDWGAIGEVINQVKHEGKNI
ncbi:MAG: hypothetical protein EPN91_11690 [Salinibacterium sp.]|nr:MAG: hypothetical protein EPN91_11690 [Salinibacterium sp.]